MECVSDNLLFCIDLTVMNSGNCWNQPRPKRKVRKANRNAMNKKWLKVDSRLNLVTDIPTNIT